MDFPANPFYPIRYHVRDYGLFGANPFGLSNFIGKGEDGSRILKRANPGVCGFGYTFTPGMSMRPREGSVRQFRRRSANQTTIISENRPFHPPWHGL
jgi:hypothetical protein